MKTLGNPTGSALIQVMVSVAIMGVVISGMMSYFDNYNRQNLIIQQKLETLQVQQDLLRELSDADLCSCNFDPAKNVANASVLHFDAANPDAFIELPQLFGACNANTPSAPLLTAGQPLPGGQTGLIVDKIRLKNLSATGTGRFRGALEVNFAASSLKMGRKPAKVNVSMSVDSSNPAQSKITACSAGPEGSGGGLLANRCPSTSLSPMATPFPEAPLGVMAYREGSAGDGAYTLTMQAPSCASPSQSYIYYICDFVGNQPAWTKLIILPCPEAGG